MKLLDDDAITEKSFEFAKRIVRLYQYISVEKKEYKLSEQLLRSGTSIGANVTEAKNAFSKKDFLAKMYIAYKECCETQYWLNLLFSCDYLTEKQSVSISSDCEELRKILSSITKTTRENLQKEHQSK